jgi:hypothetical protein
MCRGRQVEPRSVTSFKKKRQDGNNWPCLYFQEHVFRGEPQGDFPGYITAEETWMCFPRIKRKWNFIHYQNANHVWKEMLANIQYWLIPGLLFVSLLSFFFSSPFIHLFLLYTLLSILWSTFLCLNLILYLSSYPSLHVLFPSRISFFIAFAEFSVYFSPAYHSTFHCSLTPHDVCNRPALHYNCVCIKSLVLWKEAIVNFLKVLSRRLFRGIKINHEKLNSGHRSSWAEASIGLWSGRFPGTDISKLLVARGNFASSS